VSRTYGDSSAGATEPARCNLLTSDTNLIPPGAQYGATLGKSEKGNRLRYAIFASLSNPVQRVTDHS
jgi:hypothetical protein